jgi:hypothetical protein
MVLGPYFSARNADDIRGSGSSVFAWGASENYAWELLKIDLPSGSVVASALAPSAGREGGDPIATFGSQIVVGGGGTQQLRPDGSIRVYDANSLDVIRAIPVDGVGVDALSIDPTGEILASVRDPKGLETLIAVDPSTGTAVTVAAIGGQTQALVATEDTVLVSYLRFSSDNVLEGQQVELVDRHTGAVTDLRLPLVTLLGVDAQAHEVVAVSTSSPWQVLLLDPMTGELDRSISGTDSRGTGPYAFTLSGDEVVMAVDDGTAQPTILRVDLTKGETSSVDLDTSQAILALTTFGDGQVAALTENGKIVTSG